MTRLLLTLTALLDLTVSSFGQRKLILYNPQDTYVLRIGDEVGITIKGQPFIFGNWKTICKPCDSTVQKNLWTIDSIADHSFVLSQITSYSYDTISYADYIFTLKDLKKQKKSFPVIEHTFFRDTILTHIDKQDTIKVMEKKEMCVLKFPKINRQAVYYDSIQSITFSRLSSQEGCSRAYVILSGLISLFGVYELIIETSKNRPDNKLVLIAIASIVSGAIMTDRAISFRKNNVETINMAHWKRKTK